MIVKTTGLKLSQTWKDQFMLKTDSMENCLLQRTSQI